VTVQANKPEESQPRIASALPPPEAKVYDVAVVGAGPAGLFLASELAKRGLATVVIGAWRPCILLMSAWAQNDYPSSTMIELPGLSNRCSRSRHARRQQLRCLDGRVL